MLWYSGRLGLLVLTLLCITLNPALAQQRRIALVIGNAAYETGPLRNPVNDATDMAVLFNTCAKIDERPWASVVE